MADTVEGFFSELSENFDASKAAGIDATFQFDISGDNGGQWYVKLADGQAEVAKGEAEDPSLTMSATDENWQKIVSGELSGQTAFLTGRLKIRGDMSLAMKLQGVFKLG